MASYGVQFEALMAEVCRDFGARLIKSWDSDASKEEVKEFVAEAVKNFFGGSTDTETEPEPEPAKKKATKPKAKGKAKGKAVEVEVEVKAEPAKKTKKPKCQAVTAKGTPCSKCAVEGGPFCSVHLKSKDKDKGKGEASGSSSAVKPKGGKGGKGLAKTSPPKHTHGLTSPPLKENPCDLCETHGMPFELPDYEEVPKNKKKDEDDDPDYVLEEEDFEEDDDVDDDYDESLDYID